MTQLELFCEPCGVEFVGERTAGCPGCTEVARVVDRRPRFSDFFSPLWLRDHARLETIRVKGGVL